MMNRKIACSILAFLLVPVMMQPTVSGMEEEEATVYLTVQIENTPALDVPYVPTPPEVVRKMLSIADVNSRDILYDLGCGDGRIVVAAASDRRVQKAVGFDIDPERIRESVENARKAGVSGKVAFHQKNLFDVDYREATVLTLYLLPSVNLELRPKLLADLAPGSRIVSHDFDMGEWEPDKQAAVAEHRIYFWVVPANVNGVWSWSRIEQGKEYRYELRIEQRFQKVSATELTGDGIPQAVRDARIRGDRIEFIAEMSAPGGTQEFLFEGRVKSHTVTGTMTPLNKKTARGKWTADRDPVTAIPIDMTGDVRIQL